MLHHLSELGREPRLTGTAGNERARQYCARVLRSLGYRVEEQPFRFSGFLGLFAVPVIGVWSVVTFAMVVSLAAHEVPNEGLALLWASAAVLAGAAGLLRRGVIGRTWVPRSGINLMARPGALDGPAPKVWLVAHVDSKRQPVSILVRAAGVVITSLAAVALLIALLISMAAGPIGSHVFDLIGATGLVGSVPLLLSFVGDGSFGALDNASGVAAVLVAAEQLAGDDRVGILITDGEELGLAGAYAFAATHPPSIALNCDTIDDAGPYIVTTVHGSTARTAAAFQSADHGPELRVMRLMPGILTDSVAFGAHGWDSVTLSRGTWRTLSRIHTRGDTLSALYGRAIGDAAALLVRAARELA